jgi:membrane protease YdiL (CAAX protease family)
VPFSGGKRYHSTPLKSFPSDSVKLEQASIMALGKAFRPRLPASLVVSLALSLAAPGAALGAARKAKKNGGDVSPAKSGEKVRAFDSSPFSVLDDPDRPRSDIWSPALSFILPGFDQWWEGQYGYAATYTGVAIGGYAYASHVAQANNLNQDGSADDDAEDETADDKDEEDKTGLDQKDVAVRKATLGMLIAQGAGGFSTYHAFRTSVRTRKAHDQYEFLAYEESPGDILLAPFQFKFLARPTTFIPLGIGAGLMYLYLHSEPPEDMERTSFTSADAFFSGSYSYNAGTHEEAMFRGWIMPVMREYWGSDFWSNAGQSLLFAAAHLNTNPQPLPQLLLGYHLGYVTQKNDWRLAESVFIHVWWDVLAFATIFHYRQAEDDETASRILPVLWLPPLEFHF